MWILLVSFEREGGGERNYLQDHEVKWCHKQDFPFWNTCDFQKQACLCNQLRLRCNLQIFQIRDNHRDPDILSDSWEQEGETWLKYASLQSLKRSTIVPNCWEYLVWLWTDQTATSRPERLLIIASWSPSKISVRRFCEENSIRTWEWAFVNTVSIVAHTKYETASSWRTPGNRRSFNDFVWIEFNINPRSVKINARCRQRKITFPRELDTRSSERFDIVIDNPIIHANLKSSNSNCNIAKYNVH